MQHLHKRPHFDELVNYIEYKQPKIHYPNRDATFLRNSPYLSQFDGDSWIDLEEQQNNMLKEKLIENELIKIAGKTGLTHLLLKGKRSGLRTPKEPSVEDNPDSIKDFIDDVDEEQQRIALEDRAKRHAINVGLQKHLKDVAKGLTADYEESDHDYGSVLSRSMTEGSLERYFGDGPKNTTYSADAPRERASSSGQAAVYPMGINPIKLPKPTRTRSTSRLGTKREGNDPEGVPRRVRAKSRPPETIQEVKPEAKPRGRPKKNV